MANAEKTILISANNYYFFMKDFLLPKYPERNAANWVIYYKDGNAKEIQLEDGKNWLREEYGGLMMSKMQLVREINEIKVAITRLREHGDEWHTNFFVSDERLAYWIEAGQLYLLQKEYTLVVMRRRPMQWQMYLCNTKEESLSHELSECLQGLEDNISTDVLGQELALSEALSVSGFRSYMLLHRITQTYDNPQKPVEEFDSGWFANEDDLSGIMDILYENMDPRCDQLPDPEELLQDIRNHNVLAIHTEDGKELAAFLSFHRKGKYLHPEYWASRKKYRKDKLGLKLLAPYLQLNWDVRRHVGFVHDDNPMMEVYEYMGFRKDGLKDEVFVKDGKRRT